MYLVNDRQPGHIRTVQHSQRQADHLQILTPRRGGDVTRLGAHIVDNGPLQPGDQEMRALVHDLLLHTGDPVEDDGTGTTSDIVDGGLDGGSTQEDGDTEPEDIVGKARGHGGWRVEGGGWGW